jgi:hypothetical protein
MFRVWIGVVSGASSVTYDEVAASQLRRLCEGLGLDATGYVALQEFLFAPWGRAVIPPVPPYPSCIGDDHSPYEYSIVYDAAGAELRILFEATHEPSVASNHEAARALNRRLAERFGVRFDRFDAVADLFCPPDPEPPFTMWHALAMSRSGLPDFKIYLNPRVRGASRARALVEEALRRLGYAAAARSLLDEVAWRGPGLDEFNYFSLDLADSEDARVKIYLSHTGATAADVERAFSSVPSHRPGDVVAHCSAVARSEGPFEDKPVTSCFAFAGTSQVPRAATFHFPVAHYVSNDQVVAERVIDLFVRNGLPTAPYINTIQAFQPGPLHTFRGIHSYVSYRRDKAGLRFTTYLSPLLFAGHRERRELRR